MLFPTLVRIKEEQIDWANTITARQGDNLEDVFEKAVQQDANVYISPGSYVVRNPIRFKNKVRKKIVGYGAKLFIAHNDIALDFAGTRETTIEGLEIYAEPGFTPKVGLLFMRTTAIPYTEFNKVKNVRIVLPPNPSANGGYGAVALLNYGAEIFSVAGSWLEADTAAVFTNQPASFDIPTGDDYFSTVTSMSLVSIYDATFLRGRKRSLYLISTWGLTTDGSTYFNGATAGNPAIETSIDCKNITILGNIEDADVAMRVRAIAHNYYLGFTTSAPVAALETYSSPGDSASFIGIININYMGSGYLARSVNDGSFQSYFYAIVINAEQKRIDVGGGYNQVITLGDPQSLGVSGPGFGHYLTLGKGVGTNRLKLPAESGTYTLPTSYSKRIPIYDENGNFIGYLPVL